MPARILLVLTIVCAVVAAPSRVSTASPDVVIYATDVASLHGNWSAATAPDAAASTLLQTPDAGWSTVDAPLAAPDNYVEASFAAAPDTAYHVWLRLRAAVNSKYNDSVWVQFSDALDAASNRVYSIGTSNGLLVNLERCSGCGVSGWGWQDASWWLQQSAVVRFGAAATHTIRIQTREDGVQIDQIVLSPAAYLTAAPGQALNDATIVTKPPAPTAPPSAAAPPASLAFGGTPAVIPGLVEAERFDTGGEGVSYHDDSPGNNGGAFRPGDVDVQECAEGGYNVGWIAAGEWLTYTVNAAASGSYALQLRVASPSGAAMHVGFNGASGARAAAAIPPTGGWQSWTTVPVPVTVAAGIQQMTLSFDTGGINVNWINLSADALATPAPSPGVEVSALAWNIQIDDSSEAHARLAMDLALGASPQPQIIAVEEAQTALFNVYLDELQRQTGRTWQGVFAAHCGPGQWIGTTCAATYSQGVGIFSSLPIVNSSTTFLPFADCWQSARGVARAAVDVHGTVVQVFAVHLQSDQGCGDESAARSQSMSVLKSWAASFSLPQIVGGDFNGGPEQTDTASGMSPAFVDAWTLVGAGAGLTAYLPSPTRRIDYWLTDASLKAAPQTIEVLSSAGTFSDHAAVRATFRLP